MPERLLFLQLYPNHLAIVVLVLVLVLIVVLAIIVLNRSYKALTHDSRADTEQLRGLLHGI